MRQALLVYSSLLLSVYIHTVTAVSCNVTNPCPASAPCCSEFGFCGSDSYCLGGCNPFSSHALDSCRPNPVCHDSTHVFKDNSRILSNSTFFEGNATEYDWVVDKGNIMNTNTTGGELVLLLTQDNGGTRLSSTRYVHYGAITARLKTGRWAGVVTAFITMSDIKDEIDWEFPGAAVTEGQTNYFWQGVIPEGPNNGQTTKDLQDTFSTYHDYTIDWQPETLTFLVDGKAVRTVKKSDTFDASGVAHYPSTPSRIQLSLWPAGIPSSAPGTVQWAGGMIDWNDPDYKSAGHFYARIQSVTVKCSDPVAPGPNITSYVYSSNSTKEPAVSYSNKSTLLNGASPIIAVPVQLQNAIILVTALLAATLVL
ncbi:glycoside hydrolase family 16 protein [Amanita thiersii Skay4041]|uniref:Glycoside hydrolase family 16 protein n=1 Tax=Amanita thiersii Skay4041 TaxID=703135 RepID=A0A2A9NS67_9AGAR|nr:glycoside hydrolase family 16 protein [Amanita thiersii Skay4041]